MVAADSRLLLHDTHTQMEDNNGHRACVRTWDSAGATRYLANPTGGNPFEARTSQALGASGRENREDFSRLSQPLGVEREQEGETNRVRNGRHHCTRIPCVLTWRELPRQQ